MITFDIDSKNNATITGDEVPRLRERFSVENKAAKFGRFRGRFMPYRKYIITPAGKFDIGMFNEFRKWLKATDADIKIVKTEKFIQHAYPRISSTMKIPKLALKLRDYQQDIVHACNKVGRGVVVLATAGGKTLTIASLIESVYQHHIDNSRFTCLLLVPDIGLVNQTYNDFKEYGISLSCSKWTGNHDLNLKTNIIICNMGILQSKKSNLDFLQHVDLLVVDEVHKLRAGNKINKILKQLPTNNRYGFTGTMPEELEDQWNIIGKIGPMLYEKTSYQLREEKYIAKAKVYIMKLNYLNNPKVDYDYSDFDPTAKYREELKTIQTSDFRNKLIKQLCGNINNNALLLVDHIDHGQLLYNVLSVGLTGKDVYFIRGEVDVEERKRIQSLMEGEKNIICVAISKIFSTGINIKNLHYILFCAGGKAKVKIIQSIGRGLRQHADKDTLIIIDLADQYHYGIQHMKKRVKLYESENFKYNYHPIDEKILS
jgi:superfamily II DNA or RNA helicase